MSLRHEGLQNSLASLAKQVHLILCYERDNQAETRQGGGEECGEDDNGGGVGDEGEGDWVVGVKIGVKNGLIEGGNGNEC